MTKRCFKCHKARPLAGFYQHPMMADGHLNKCKECTKRDSVLNYRRKMADPAWVDKERARQVRKVLRTGPLLRAKFPEKYRARRLLQGAVEKGKIAKPESCQQCARILGKRFIHGHHSDYSRPFDVQWLCAKCHAAVEGRASIY